MTKIIDPLLSFNARGKIGKLIALTRRQKQNIAEKMPIPHNPKTFAQLEWRHMFLKVIALWHLLSVDEKQEWESLARRHHMTGYAWFLSQALRPNPGIYLPLQGGVMAGDIDMAGHQIEDLPDPTQLQDADTKAARDAAIAAHGANFGLHAKVIRKPSDQTVNNSTILINDDDLVFAVEANEVWEFHLYIRHNATAVADIDIAFAVPAGATCTFKSYQRSTAGDEENATAELRLNGLAADKVMSMFYLYIGGGTSGNVQLRWAQGTAEVTDSKVLANSYIIAHRLACA